MMPVVGLIAITGAPDKHVPLNFFWTTLRSADTVPVVVIVAPVENVIPDPAVSEVMPPPEPAGHTLRQSVPRQSDGVVIFAPFVPRGPPFTVMLPESK
ncbi:MAG: hypothetical protein WC030_02545 [Candidatus Paceibacterota bacterium]